MLCQTFLSEETLSRIAFLTKPMLQSYIAPENLHPGFHVKGVTISSSSRRTGSSNESDGDEVESGDGDDEVEIFFDAESAAAQPSRPTHSTSIRLPFASPLKKMDSTPHMDFQVRNAKEQLVALRHLFKTLDATTRRCEDAVLKIGEGNAKHTFMLRRVTQMVAMTVFVFSLAFGYRFRSPLYLIASSCLSFLYRKLFVK